MTDDFRLTVEFDDPGQGIHLARLLHEHELEGEIRDKLGPRVLVTHDGPHVFLYTATPQQVQAAAEVVRDLLAEHALHARLSTPMRWHPAEMRWEHASVPLPRTDKEVEAEHERWEEQQAKESRELGYAEWEVRVELPSHKEAVELAKRLEDEGIKPIIRRWKYLLIGVENDDAAKEMADLIRREAPAGSVVKAEPSATIAWEVTAKNAFAVFGALGPGPTLRR
jgi:hypothetical protein